MEGRKGDKEEGDKQRDRVVEDGREEAYGRKSGVELERG